MSQFDQDIHHRTTTRLRQIIPDFVESEYPQFVEFMNAYYEFLEQYDSEPVQSTYVTQSGVVSVLSGNSTVVGSNTSFTSLSEDQHIRVGSERYQIRTIDSDTSLLLYDVPVRTFYANTYLAEEHKSVRQAKGALNQLLLFHDVANTLEDLAIYFRDTYLRDIPHGSSATETLLPRILEFYQARGSELAFKFLFRILYGREVEITYPYEKILTFSDNQYEKPTIIKVRTDSLTGNGMMLETRELIGFTSGARATCTKVTQGYEGDTHVTTLFLDNITRSVVSGDVLLNSQNPLDDGSTILVTSYGTPPQGVETQIYQFSLITEDTVGGDFLVGETISTLPTTDPVRITGEVLGAVVGFTIASGGHDYTLGDVVFPPPGFHGGYGAIGRVTGYSNTDITAVDILDGGEGYYTGLSLVADNAGTGGSGLAGTVGRITTGFLLLDEDISANVADGDILTFVDYATGNVISEYHAEQEKVDYFAVGILLSDLLYGIRLNSNIAEDDGSALLIADDTLGTEEVLYDETGAFVNAISNTYTFTIDTTSNYVTMASGDTSVLSNGLSILIQNGTSNAFGVTIASVTNSSVALLTGTPLGNVTTGTAAKYEYTTNITGLLQETAIPINTSDWGAGNTLSAFYNINLSSVILTLITAQTIYPWYVNGIRTAIGRIAELNISSLGSDYIFGPPTISVSTPLWPTSDDLGTVPVSNTYYVFESAIVQANVAVGQIGEIQVVSAGSAYTQNTETFTVNSTTSVSSSGGDGAELGLILAAAITPTEGRFRNTRGMLSEDRVFQSIDRYQPFAYELVVEEDITRYRDAVVRLVHPAGGLLLGRQLVMTELNSEVRGPDTSIVIV